MKPLLIIDIDGTIADNSHRAHFIKKPKRDWVSFHKPELVAADPVIEIAKRALTRLWKLEASMRFLTGRMESLRTITKKWMLDNCQRDIPDNLLIMRAEGDYRPAPIFKKEKIEALKLEFPNSFLIMLDDDPRNLEMFREFGLPLKAPDSWDCFLGL